MIAARPDIDELVAIDPTDGTHERGIAFVCSVHLVGAIEIVFGEPSPKFLRDIRTLLEVYDEQSVGEALCEPSVFDDVALTDCRRKLAELGFPVCHYVQFFSRHTKNALPKAFERNHSDWSGEKTFAAPTEAGSHEIVTR